MTTGQSAWFVDDPTAYAQTGARQPIEPDPAGSAEPLPDGGPGRTGRSWRWLPRTLTWRLVTGVVALVAVLVVAIGFATYFALRSSLYDRLDQQLQSTATSKQSITELFSSDAEAGVVGVRAPQNVWVVALDSAGNVLANPRSPSVDAMKLDAHDRRRLAALGEGSIVQVSTADGQDLRVIIRRVSIAVSPVQAVPAAVVVGLSTGEVHRTLDKLLDLELVIGTLAVVLALVATAGGVRFSLRHLHRVTRTAQDVAAELSPSGSGLERRVPVTDAGSEVGQLAESMNTLLSTVETQFAARLDSERRMRQFMADASHELRTPLTSIRGYAELARMQRTLGNSDSIGDDTAENLERIESEGTRMSRLVEDLLTLARGDQGSRAEMASIDVSELLDDVVASSRAAFGEREIVLHDDAGLTVLGDHDQLLRAVRNLVSNAATHTPDGTIEVRASAAGDGVAIQIIDQGPGLPPEEAAHVFERFWRADKARTRARGGTGLGLAIVASIVQQHAGTVQFESTVQDGTTVTLWLPTRTGALD